jgi:hypothetical protein
MFVRTARNMDTTRRNLGLMKREKTAIPTLITHIAWVITTLSTESEIYQLLTGAKSIELLIWVDDACHKLATHLHRMRSYDGARLLATYGNLHAERVLEKLNAINGLRNEIYTHLDDIETSYHDRVSVELQLPSRLPAVIDIHEKYGRICDHLVSLRKILHETFVESGTSVQHPSAELNE